MKKCPVCKDSQLQVRYRQEVEIDYCPECRGIWLDRGELDKIIERSTEELAAAASAAENKPAEPPHKQKRNLITELFDF